MSTITISKKLIKFAIDEKEGVVILSLEKWKAIEAGLEDLEMYRSEKLAKEISKRRKEKSIVSLAQLIKKHQI